MKKIFLIFVFVLIIIVISFFIFGRDTFVWQKIDTTTCSWRGGSLITGGCGIARCTVKCAVPYRDGGKPCTNSSQCSHSCVVDDSRLPDPFSVVNRPEKNDMKSLKQCAPLEKNSFDCKMLNLSGTCEQKEPANCENRWQFNDGIIAPLFADCSL